MNEGPIDIGEFNLPGIKYKYPCGPNEFLPELVGVSNNLILFPHEASASRLYMAGNMIPKSVVTEGNDERIMVTGNEYNYAETARCVKAPANMIVEKIFYANGLNESGDLLDGWTSLYVIFKNEEMNMYDLLVMPRFHTQNTSVGFEYVYDPDLMRRLQPGATFPKGTIFGKSPRVNKDGQWCFGMNTVVAAMSSHITEEDAVYMTESYARKRLRCMFKHERNFQWDENELVPLMLYGTDENPSPFARVGDRIRPDGIVMGFRRRSSKHALSTLTKKALRVPDTDFDILFYAPPNSEVMGIEVTSERMKNASNNRSTDYIDQPHTVILDKYERKQNDMWNEVMRWYEGRIAANRGQNISLTGPMKTFIINAYGKYTRNNSTGKTNRLRRSSKRVKQKDWSVSILLREMVGGKVKFKFAGLNGDKGVCVIIIPDDHAPMYADGTRAEFITNNTPAFRRQIFSMLMELSINYINVRVQKLAIALRKEGNYDEAYQTILDFIRTGFPEFAEIVEEQMITKEIKDEYVDYVARTHIHIQVRSDSKLFGVNLINALRAKYNFKPQKASWIGSLGERVESINPILIANQHIMMLDKFGTDMSAQAFPKANIYGIASKLNDSNKFGTHGKDQGNRNHGEAEEKVIISQTDPQEISKRNAMAYSPDVRISVTRRILRADDPFDIDQAVKPEEYETNRIVRMATSMLSDSGYGLRHERPDDLTPEYQIPSASFVTEEMVERLMTPGD